MAKHTAPVNTGTLTFKDFIGTEAPKHRATPVEDGFVPIRDAWTTADDIKQQRHEYEAEQFKAGN